MGNLVIRNDSFIQAMHNNIQCIESLDPNDKGTSRQYWFTASMLANIFDIALNTVKNNVDFLVKWGEVTIVKNLTIVQTQNSAGAVKDTTLYDLQVFNKLAMQLRTDAAMEIRNKFSDILVEIETTGQYNAIKLDRKTQLQLAIINSKPNSVEQLAAIAALEELHAEEKKALEDKTKELEDENEIIRGEYYNTKQIYDIIMQEYPEALQQAKTTNYNKLRKALKKLSNGDKESYKVYKKHVTNSQGNIEWRQEYYFVKKILLKVLDCISDNIKYIANVR